MPVPKRKHSKRRTKTKRYPNYVKGRGRRSILSRLASLVTTKDGKAKKRPHVEEYIKV